MSNTHILFGDTELMGFSTFLGNAKAVGTVRGFLASGRVPGALLFTGPDGVGKKTLALMLAKALVCEKRGDDFCGECGACRRAEEMLASARDDLARRREAKDTQRRVEGLVYFDLQLIEPITKFILTEQIRQLRSVAYTRPFQLRQRVFVIDQAHTVHWQAVDLLLKVLEEPPETTTMVLVCSNAYALRPTIRSRCLRIPLHPVDDAIIRDLVASEGRVPKAQRELAVRVAAGSVAGARTFESAEFERKRRPWIGFLEGVMRETRGGVTDPDWEGLFSSAKALTESRDNFEQTLRIGYVLLRDLQILQEVGESGPVVNLDILPKLMTWAERLGRGSLEKLKAGLDEAYRLQIRNVNAQLGFETLAFDILDGQPSPAVDRS